MSTRWSSVAQYHGQCGGQERPPNVCVTGIMFASLNVQDLIVNECVLVMLPNL